MRPLYIYLNFRLFVQVRTCCNECLAGFVVLVLLEVLDEARCEVFGFGVPLFCICVGIAGIKDLRIYAGKLGRNLEVEDRKGLGGSLKDSTVEDSVDDTTGIFDRDTFAGTVPTGVHEVSLGT